LYGEHTTHFNMLHLILTLILIVTTTWTYYTYKNLWQENRYFTWRW